nr:hypothetical protein [Tanacetum cinerariifolium]
MMIYNDMYKPHAQSVSKTSRNTLVDNSLTAELATYKEQVELNERRARNFEKELHSVKLQLASTINHSKLMVEEVTSLKKDFKQKENSYLEDLLDMKSLKEKVKDRLFKQDQSLKTVHMLCRPKPYYNELNKVAIGYKNPLCLTRTKQVQSALYNGHDIIKNNHVPAKVQNIEDTLEIAEITRREMNDKSIRPIKALTLYPPNTPATLVPRVLPIKNQVKIQIFTLIQLFLEFNKTCKKRITPTELTKRERGFEQTKECYLKEVIPFFKTLKEYFKGIQKALTKEIKELKDVFKEIDAEEYFKGIQKALTKEIKELKDVFKEIEAEVAQNVVDRKHDEIEWKNLLIANDNLIVKFLSKEARCLELKAELSNLRDKSHTNNHNELVNRFSNLE